MKLIPFSENDYLSLYDFMQPLWMETYGGFLSETHVRFLLDKYFLPENIAAFRAQGYEYYKLDDVGVLVFIERKDETFMDKLYLLPSARGKGYPAFAFSEMLKRGKDVVLSVNQKNARAYACYKKNGFILEKAVDVDFGNGMINQDYILRKKYEK